MATKTPAASAARTAQRKFDAAAKGEAKAMRNAATRYSARGDSWSNLYTGVGVKGVDKLQSSVFELRPKIGYNEVFALYRENAIAKRQVDDLVSDASRSGFTFVCEEDPDLVQAVHDDWERMHAVAHCADGLRWGLVCGGAVGMLMTDDEALDSSTTGVMSTPLDPTQMGGIQQIVVVDSRYALPDMGSYTTDSLSPNFGLPEYYQVTPFGYSTATPSYRCHWTRIVRFEGVPTDMLTRVGNLTWGDSVYQASWDAMMRYGMITGGAALAASEFGLKIMKMKNLTQLMASEQYDVILGRVMGVKMGLSAAKIALLEAGNGPSDPGEELTLTSQPVTGLPELWDRAKQEVAMAIHEPLNRLFGTQAGALASSETDHKTWAEWVHLWQLAIVKALTRITALELASKNGPKLGKPDAHWKIIPNPIDPPDTSRMLEERERQAKIDAGYITNRVLEPSEVRTSRFGGTVYSHETTLDKSLSGMIEANDKAALKAGEEEAEPTPTLEA